MTPKKKSLILFKKKMSSPKSSKYKKSCPCNESYRHDTNP